MANLMLAYPNRIDEATLSGGDWESALPLTHLQDRILQRLARSATLDAADTQFTIALSKSRPIRVVALANHNLTIEAEYRLTGSAASHFSTTDYTSGWLPVWPAGIFDLLTLEWEDDNFWTGQIDAETRAAYTSALIHILDQQRHLRYWKIELRDAGNPAGYVQIGRVFLGQGWQPTINHDYGDNLGWDTATIVDTSQGDVDYFERREGRRVFRATFSWLDEREALEQVFEMQRSQGIDQEVVLIADPDDQRQGIRRNFLGRLRQLSPIEHPYFGYRQTSFEIQEIR